MEILIGVLAAWGTVMLVWTLLGLMLMPLTRRKDIRITAVVRGENSAPFLEQYIRGLKWLRDLGLLWWDIAVISDRLSPEAVCQARRFLEKESNSAVMQADDLLDWMER